MKLFSNLRLLCGIFFLSLASSLAIANDPIVIAAEDSWPPFSDVQGQGISYDLVQAALSHVDREFSIEVVPYARALKATEIGSVDACWNVTRQPTTEALFYFGKEPLLLAQASYFFPKGKALNFNRPAMIPDDLRIGVIIDYEYGHEYTENQHRFDEVRVSSQKQIINMLLTERIDAAIMFDEVASYHLQQMGLSADVIDKGEINHVSDIYVAFSRKNPEHKTLAKELDQGLRWLRATGKYDPIFNAAKSKDGL